MEYGTNLPCGVIWNDQPRVLGRAAHLGIDARALSHLSLPAARPTEVFNVP